MSVYSMDLGELRSKIDMEGKYVDFSSIRTAVSVLTLTDAVGLNICEPKPDGECRGKCPVCKSERSLALNINTNRFNCFKTGCGFKGGGVIDFTSKLFEVPAKEAGHLIACAYGIQPYTAEDSGAGNENGKAKTLPEQSREVEAKPAEFVNRKDYDELRAEFHKFKNFVYEFVLEQDAPKDVLPSV